MGRMVDNSEIFINASNDKISEILETIGLQAETYAKLECPVDTGRLRNSITHTHIDKTAYIGTNVDYAPHVEFGTSKQRAKPYLKPAVTQHNDEYKAMALSILRQ